MKKPLLLFLAGIIVLLAAKLVYDRYCASKPNGCQKVKQDPKNSDPKKGIDW
jgi:hypothetical protein